MSGVNKEAPVIEDTKDLAAKDTTESQSTPSATATPSQVEPATTAEAIKDAAVSAANTVSDKTSKIFGSFTSSVPTTTPKEGEGETRKPLFGGFSTGSASAWATAPTTLGGFGSGSSLTPKKEEEKEEEV